MHQACEVRRVRETPRPQPSKPLTPAIRVLLIAAVLSAAILARPVPSAASTKKVPDLAPSSASDSAPVSETGAKEPGTTGKGPTPAAKETTTGARETAAGAKEIALIAAIALLFAWLRVFKDFRHYKGLLHTLLWSGYTWVFLIVIGAITFVLDWLLLPLLESSAALHGVAHPMLALGHVGFSSLSSAYAGYGSPALIARIPLGPRSAPVPDQAEKPNPEKTSEMNAVFEAMWESLECSVNGILSDWTLKYDWPVLKYVAKNLATGREVSKALTSDEIEALCRQAGACQTEAELWEDRQRKYKLLRKMMDQSSFQDLRKRLANAGKMP